MPATSANIGDTQEQIKQLKRELEKKSTATNINY